MKPGYILTLGIFLLKGINLQSQTNQKDTIVDIARAFQHEKKRMNFFVISKPKKLFDAPTRFNIIRAKIKSMLHPGKFSCIVAKSANEMSEKIQYRLNKKNAVIGSLWFDSHGCYTKGYSLFTVGEDEFNYRNIDDPEKMQPLMKLSAYCDTNSKIGIGSCYGGATYTKPCDGAQELRMNGDSLMRKMGLIFPVSTIYASESWVMTKPGLFREKFAMAGFPLRKKFKDISYEPVWNKLGMWNSYQAIKDAFTAVNCVTLTKYGNIRVRYNSYQSIKKVQKRIAHNREKLRPNLLKV